MLRVAMISVHTCPLARLGSRETGGMNVYVRELSRQLGRHGVAVDVFTRRQEPGVEQVVEFGENARVIHLDAGPSRTIDKYDVLRYLPQFLEGVRDFRRRTGSSYHLATAITGYRAPWPPPSLQSGRCPWWPCSTPSVG